MPNQSLIESVLVILKKKHTLKFLDVFVKSLVHEDSSHTQRTHVFLVDMLHSETRSWTPENCGVHKPPVRYNLFMAMACNGYLSFLTLGLAHNQADNNIVSYWVKISNLFFLERSPQKFRLGLPLGTNWWH